MMGQQPQHFNSSVGPPNSQGRFAPPPNQGPAGWQPQPGTVHNSAGQAPVDILGLADKAASAVQALQNQGRLQQQNVRQQGQPPYGGPPGHSIPPHGMGQPSHPPQNYHANVPQQQQQQQPPPPYGPQGQRNSIGGGGPGSVAGANGGAAGLAAANANRRRTTASMTELPVTVQYAVQVSVSEYVIRFIVVCCTFLLLKELILTPLSVLFLPSHRTSRRQAKSMDPLMMVCWE